MRCTVNERLELVDEAGNVIGRVVFELDDPAALPHAPLRGQTSTATSKATSTSTSKSKSKQLHLSGEDDRGPAHWDLDVAAAWGYWVEKRNPRFPKLEPSQAKLIRKGIDAIGEDDLRIAMDALLASDWHRERNQLNLSTILATRPGGPTLRDQLTSWIERAPSSQEASSEQDRLNGRLRRWRVELGKLEEQDELRPGDIERRDELRGLIAELGELV